jgi:serine/threonine protein kinase
VVRDQGRFGGRFQVESLVGSGGMGMVFRGRDLLDGQSVALKVLRKQGHDATERLFREAEALAALSHPAIVRYVAHGATVQGEPYLVMEWLDGETLEDRLARGAIGPVAAARLGCRVLGALAAAHEHGIVHRDIKPSNLFLPGADLDQAKLLDFGIARRTQDDLRVTRPGKALGTPMYMAPEQARDGEAVDGRADIFSLGCVLYECATGEPPPLRAGYAAEAHTWDDVECTWLYSALPQPLRDVLSRMLALEPARRPDNAEALADELASVAETLATMGQDAIPVRQYETLSGDEQRMAAVVILSKWQTPDDLHSAALQELLAEHGARGERLSDGTTKVTFAGKSTPLDQATQAARCALRPTCLGRRMNQTTQNLLAHVVPAQPLRQWVLSLPYALRAPLAYEPGA